MKILSILWTALLVPSVALANPFQQKTMQDPFSMREVERSVVMPKGWIELSFELEAKESTSYWNSDGEAVDFEGANWLYSTERLSLRWGFVPNAEVFASLPVHWVALTNDIHGTDRSGLYLGDPKFGTRIKLVESTAPSTSLAAVVEIKAPAGNESPGSYIGGPTTFQSFVTTWDWRENNNSPPAAWPCLGGLAGSTGSHPPCSTPLRPTSSSWWAGSRRGTASTREVRPFCRAGPSVSGLAPGWKCMARSRWEPPPPGPTRTSN